MRRTTSRFGFTLVEVNLAIFVMAIGILSMCGLYALGYRENRQSEEDVYATAYADSFLAPLVAGLSSPQMKWSDWVKIGDAGNLTSEAVRDGVDGRWPAGGWCDYVIEKTKNNRGYYQVSSSWQTIADTAFGNVKGVISSAGATAQLPSMPKGYAYGLVVTRRGAIVQLAFRMSRRAQTLLAQPVFVAEVHFNGGFGNQGGGQ